jgi:D-alanyl-D-alanine carboxypeptidase (penicillin-binding protein 5/6)
MKKRRLFSLFLSFALLLPLFSLTSADAYEDFTLDAKAGLLIEADTGEILYEKNAHQENFPASLTKVMVALGFVAWLVFEAIDEGKIALTDSVTATESAFEGLSSDGSTANIVPGETMTVEQLLNCMLIVSANEACNILGETLYGSVDAFVARTPKNARRS